MSQMLQPATKDFAITGTNAMLSSKIVDALKEIIDILHPTILGEINNGSSMGVNGGVIAIDTPDIPYARYGWEYTVPAQAIAKFETEYRKGRPTEGIPRIVLGDEVRLVFEMSFPLISRISMTVVFNKKSSTIGKDSIKYTLDGAAGYMYVGTVLEAIAELKTKIQSDSSSAFKHAPVLVVE